MTVAVEVVRLPYAQFLLLELGFLTCRHSLFYCFFFFICFLFKLFSVLWLWLVLDVNITINVKFIVTFSETGM